jgi:hypothetical protein
MPDRTRLVASPPALSGPATCGPPLVNGDAEQLTLNAYRARQNISFAIPDNYLSETHFRKPLRRLPW